LKSKNDSVIMSLIFKTMMRSSKVEAFLESVWLVKTHKD
jgi:hypothetical protein